MSLSGEKGLERRLAAIFAADVEGYSRLMRADEVGTMQALTAAREVMDRLIAEHRGRIANTAGDSVLAEFPSVVDAIKCAVSVQEATSKAHEVTRPAEQSLRFRIGVHVGDVMVRGGDLFGDGVNVAARLQALAEPGGVCVSEEAHQYAHRLMPFEFTDLGLQSVKNIEEGVRAFSLRLTGQCTPVASTSRAKPVSDKPSVAVLPFDNLSSQDESYFSDGIAEELITGLARFRSLFVIARNSSFSFRGKSLDLADIGRRLGVSYLVEGSVRRGGDRIRITVQLIEAGTGAHLWAERYDRKLDDLFAVQEEVAQIIASTLFGRIEEARLNQTLRNQTESPAAYDLLLRGLAHFRGYVEDDNHRACEMFEKAVAIDPQYSLAHAYLAFARVALGGYAAASPKVLDEAFARAAQAVDLDPQESRCHRMLALICLHRREYDTAEHHFHRALQLNPNDADGTQQMGYLLALRGRPEEALKWMAAARRLNPFHPTWYNFGLGIALYSLKRYAEAAQTFKRFPNPWPWARARLAACCAQRGESAEVQAQVSEILRLRPDFSIATFLQRDVLLERVEDRELFREGLIKAGLPQ